MITEVLEKSLADLSYCAFCLEEEDIVDPDLALTKDHLIPKKACDNHQRALKAVKCLSTNQAKIHWWEHRKIEEQKQIALCSQGLPGLIEVLAAYPRSQDPKILEMQRLQWISLFQSAHDGLREAIDKIPPFKESEYSKAIDRTSHYLELWRGGDFVSRRPIFVPVRVIDLSR